jgi:two-component system, chemotaxis family, sensor kinase CheA
MMDTHENQGTGFDEAELELLRSDPELAGMFFAEALDHLGSIEATVLALEGAPGDVKLLNDLFRPFHTIKGNSGALGITSVQAVAHRVENLLDLGRSGKHPIGADEIDVILKAVDVVTAMIQGLKHRVDGQPAQDLSHDAKALMDEVERIIAGGAQPAAPVAEPVAAPEPAPVVVVAAAVQNVAPPQSREEAELAAFANEMFDGPAQPASAATPQAVTPVAAPIPAAVAEAPRAPVKAAAEQVKMDTVKVDTRKLDNLVDMVGELVIAQAMIQEDPALLGLANERLNRNLSQLRRITTDLQRNAMAMRMVPVRQTFQKMARLVRDLGKKSGKVVELELSGEDTELDRQVVEDINDPLMHMVRNSVDHGIEDAAARAKTGKAASGKLSLSAYHQGGSIVISVADDGAGLNTEKIRKKAIAQGLITEDQILSENEIHQMIFRPGFSTADKVTEISGRGVGMDVVRRNIEALRGRVEIQSVAGKGTTFLIKLPLTLAILDGMVLRAAGRRFVLPTFAVRESLRPSPDQVHSVQGRPNMIQVRSSLLPLASLAELLGFEETPMEPTERTAVVVDDNGHHLAVLVDELLGKQEVVMKSLGVMFSGVRGIAGGAIMGDGRVGLILDAAGLTSLMGNASERAA